VRLTTGQLDRHNIIEGLREHIRRARMCEITGISVRSSEALLCGTPTSTGRPPPTSIRTSSHSTKLCPSSKRSAVSTDGQATG
jgi:hypothetical protein